MSNKQKREIQLNDNVLVMNNTMGGLVIKSPATNRTWRVNEFGKTVRMQVQDIIDVMAESPIFEQGYAIILDEDVVEYLNLTESYKNIIKLNDIDKLFNMSEKKIKEIFVSIPETMRTDIARYIKDKSQKGDKSFISITKLRLFENLLGIKLVA